MVLIGSDLGTDSARIAWVAGLRIPSGASQVLKAIAPALMSKVEASGWSASTAVNQTSALPPGPIVDRPGLVRRLSTPEFKSANRSPETPHRG